MLTPYGTILDSSAAGCTRLVLTDGAMTLQTLTLTHEVTLPAAAVDTLLAALRQEAKDAITSQRGDTTWHWRRSPLDVACGIVPAHALLTPFPEDVTCAACLDTWLPQMVRELRDACAVGASVPSTEAR